MKHLAFLRAINVGGNRIIKMTDLKKSFEDLGFKNVKTYIQTGNVFFDSNENSSSLEKKIEAKLLKDYGFEVTTFVRTIDEIKKIAEAEPFKDKANGTTIQTYVSFLPEEPTGEQKKLVENLSGEIDKFKIIGRELYILIYKDKGKSAFTNNFTDKYLKMSSTNRNMKTIYKLEELFL